MSAQASPQLDAREFAPKKSPRRLLADAAFHARNTERSLATVERMGIRDERVRESVEKLRRYAVAMRNAAEALRDRVPGAGS